MTWRIFVTVVLISASASAACDAEAPEDPAAQPEAAEGTTEAASAETPAEDPLAGEPSSGAEALARAVHVAAGGEKLDEVAQLDFRFLVTSETERVFEAMHRWDRRGNRDRVTFTDDEGRRRDLVVDLETREVCGTVDGEPIDPADREAFARGAYGRWVNDSYWLVLPLKLLDPGVRLTLEEPRVHEGVQFEILRLDFEDVGLTPGDRYWLFIDPRTHRIQRWEMLLEGQHGAPRATSWEAYREVGPLTLAHDHRAGESPRHIRFEQTAAHGEVNAPQFAIPGCR